MGRARTRRIGLHRRLPDLRREAPHARRLRIPRVGQRQAPLQEGVRHVDDARRDPGRSRRGTRSAKVARRQDPEEDHRRAGQDHQHRNLNAGRLRAGI